LKATPGCDNGCLILRAASLARRLVIILTVTGSFVAPTAAATPLPLKAPHHVNFGAQALGTTGEQFITLTNRSSDAVFIDGIGVSSSSGAFLFDFANNQCVGITLQPGDSCTYGIFFSPVIAGHQEGQSDVGFVGPEGSQIVVIALSGRGTS
jgi:hypothetical protein